MSTCELMALPRTASTSAVRLFAPMVIRRSLATPASGPRAEAAELTAAVTAAQQEARLKVEKLMSQSDRAERTLRRFWKTVGIRKNDQGLYVVQLDRRDLKSPSGKPLHLPPSKLAVAALIAHEWDTQEEVLKPHGLPITSLAARAMESLSDPKIHEQVVESLLKYLETDTVCFHQSEPEELVKLQDQHWKPLVAWLNETYSTNLGTFDGLLASQPAESIAKLRDVIQTFDSFQLAAFERAVMTTKSFIIALGLVKGRLSVEEAAVCANVEVQSQINRWGEVEDTHDLDHQDVRTRLGSAAILLTQYEPAA